MGAGRRGDRPPSAAEHVRHDHRKRTFQVADAIILLATLSFLGFGLPPPAASWGGMLSQGTSYLFDGYWWEVYPAGVLIMVTVSPSTSSAKGCATASVRVSDSGPGKQQPLLELRVQRRTQKSPGLLLHLRLDRHLLGQRPLSRGGDMKPDTAAPAHTPVDVTEPLQASRDLADRLLGLENLSCESARRDARTRGDPGKRTPPRRRSAVCRQAAAPSGPPSARTSPRAGDRSCRCRPHPRRSSRYRTHRYPCSGSGQPIGESAGKKKFYKAL